MHSKRGWGTPSWSAWSPRSSSVGVGASRAVPRPKRTRTRLGTRVAGKLLRLRTRISRSRWLLTLPGATVRALRPTNTGALTRWTAACVLLCSIALPAGASKAAPPTTVPPTSPPTTVPPSSTEPVYAESLSNLVQLGALGLAVLVALLMVVVFSLLRRGNDL